jgi:Mg2+/citrate symporter
MTWVIEAVVVGVLCYLMVDGYRAIKERKRLERLEREMDAKIKAGREERARFDEEVRRLKYPLDIS